MTYMSAVISREQPIDYGTLDEYLRKSCPKLGIKDVEGIDLYLFKFNLKHNMNVIFMFQV